MTDEFKEDFIYQGKIVERKSSTTKTGKFMVTLVIKPNEKITDYNLKHWFFPEGEMELSKATGLEYVTPLLNEEIVGKPIGFTVKKKISSFNNTEYWGINNIFPPDSDGNSGDYTNEWEYTVASDDTKMTETVEPTNSDNDDIPF